ncbi:MAG: hypothetical protein R3335_10435, partial [Anaerolineales bacterium]|nr:hypothetical protein [Anaerolineales bacterium]
LATSMFIARRVFGSWTAGTAAGWLLAVPVVTFSLYTTASLGNYGEVLLLGNLIIICSLRIAVQLRADKLANHWLWLVFGLLAGIGFWAFGLILVYIVPAVAYIGYFFIRSAPGQAARNYAVACALSLAGFLAGSMPFWIFILREGPLAAIQELGGSAVSGVEGLGYLGQIFQHVAGFLLFGLTAALGLRPSWEVRWLAIPLLPLAVLFWAGVLTFTIRSIRLDQQRRADLVLLCGVGGTLTLGFILTPFGADPSGRYFLPLVVIAAILAGGFIQFLAAAYSRLAWVLLACVSVFQLWGNLDTALRNPPGITTQFDAVTQIDHSYDQELIDFLNQSGTTRGYSNYWVAYPLAFLSGEEIIFVPRLPYHPDFRYTERDDRYAPYAEIVASADEIAYITTNHPDLDQKIRQGFSELGVDWSERRIGDYQIFYGLSEPVRPIQIGFGGTTP